jgi:hypothetical protein
MFVWGMATLSRTAASIPPGLVCKTIFVPTATGQNCETHNGDDQFFMNLQAKAKRSASMVAFTRAPAS